jgi:hypothetical protein
VRQVVLLTLLSFLLALASLGVFAWALLSGGSQGLDGLLLLLVSLLLAVVFFGVTLALLRSQPLQALFATFAGASEQNKEEKKPPEAQAAN